MPVEYDVYSAMVNVPFSFPSLKENSEIFLSPSKVTSNKTLPFCLIPVVKPRWFLVYTVSIPYLSYTVSL